MNTPTAILSTGYNHNRGNVSSRVYAAGAKAMRLDNDSFASELGLCDYVRGGVVVETRSYVLEHRAAWSTLNVKGSV